MSSWFSELAGKAENILNKIDQNAASVLKTDENDRDQLVEVKTNIDNTINAIKQNDIKRNTSSNSLKLSRTPKKLITISPERKSNQIDAIEIVDTKLMNGNEDGLNPNITSSLSNSSRRSSWSSKTEGIQTVIEYPMEKMTNELSVAVHLNGTTPMHTSTSSVSLQNIADEKTELMATKIVLNQVKSERDQLKAEIDDLKHQQFIAQNNDLINELTATIDQLTLEREQLQQKITELDASNSEYSKIVSELEVRIAKLHQIETDLNEKLAWAKSEAEHAANELQQYRARAQHTLQMKDDIIAELKSMRKNGSSNEDIDTDSHAAQIDFIKLKEERDALIGDVNLLRDQLNSNKQMINTLELRCLEAEKRFNDSEQTLSNALKQEKLRYNQLDETLRTQTKELKAVRDELKRNQFVTSTKLHEKENEILKLRTQLSQQSMATSSTTVNSTDDRVYSLTQSLVQKQNALESLTAERNAIRLQLEKLEMQHRETMQLLRQQRLPQIINVNDTDDAKSLLPNFMQENPFDTRVARRMKRAYSSLDAAGVRLGVFLRRYPVVRTMVIVYVAILHLWVMFVLLSSTPN